MTMSQYLKIMITMITAVLFFVISLSFIYPYRSYAANWKMQALPDTGQVISYTTIFGEDSDYSNNPLSYTDNSNGTVSDNVTGLVWQQNEVMSTTTKITATAYCNDLVLGSSTDWYLPTSHELFSLVDLSTGNPPLSSTYFASSISDGYWWSSTPQVSDTTKYWVVNAGGGIGPKPEADFYMRCVRSDSSSAFTQTFTSNGDNTVTESSTSLMWQQDGTSAISTTWTAALTYCETLTLADYSDWRLPNTKELRSISDDDNLANPSVNSAYISVTAILNSDPNDATGYWSSSTNANGSTQAWIVDFYNGLTTHADKTKSNYVICTRNTTLETYLPIIFKN